jgi:regulation of enolase protein 1 (concanavalin A-like superfamily)
MPPLVIIRVETNIWVTPYQHNRKPMTSSSKLNTESVPVQILTSYSTCDIGSPRLNGAAKATETGWNITAGGTDIWEKSDQFHFVFKDFSGDFDVAIRVKSFTPAHLYSKAGLMIRENLKSDSAHLMFFVFAEDAPRNNNLGAYEMQFRPIARTDCQAICPAVRPPAPPEFPAAFPNSWLRATRRGNQFSASASTDGIIWKLYGEKNLPLASTVKVGPALTSHNADVSAEAIFCNHMESN